MSEIDHLIQKQLLAEETETKETLSDKINTVKQRIKEKKEALAQKESNVVLKAASTKSLESFQKEWTDQIQFQTRVLEAFNNKLNEP